MNVLIAALELAPYSAGSPSSETVASLTKALKLLGHDVTVAVPRLPVYEDSGLMAARQLSPLKLEGNTEATLYDVQLPSGVKLTLIDVAQHLFEPDRALDTQAEALGGFAAAVAALVERQAASGAAFDVVHAHDAAAGLSLLKVGSGSSGRVLTVHDAERAGRFSLETRDALGIPEERAGTQGFASGDGLCLLKGLVGEADAIVVPSDTYGRQMKAPEKYGALSRAFQAVQLTGVGEGVDYSVYNPATDSALTSRYDAPSPANKGRNKTAVLDELRMEYDINRPLVFVEDVPNSDSAMETLLGALPGLVRNDVALVISGSKELGAKNAELLEPFSGQVKWLDDVDAVMRRRILAASDFYLSVARRDPSGQRLLQASRYGAIPVAFRADSVTDVVVDADAELRTGTGIVFEAMTQRALVSAAGRVVAAYRSAGFPGLLSRVMRQDLGWDRAARRHLQIYRDAAARA